MYADVLEARGLVVELTDLASRPLVVENNFEVVFDWVSFGMRDRAANVDFEGVFRTVEGCAVGI